MIPYAEESGSRRGSWRLTLWTLAGLLAIQVCYWLAYAYAPGFHQRFLRGEDRLIEWLTFAGFLGAALVAWSLARRKRGLVLAYLAGLGLFFFVCAGEEISWGQRLFGFETPEKVRAINEQQEFNLHNLSFERISPLGLVSIFMMVFGIAAPLVCWNRVPRFVPVAAVAPVFVYAELLSVIRKELRPMLVQRFGEEVALVVRLDTAEYKEMVWGVACLVAMLALRRAWVSSAALCSGRSS